MPKNGSKGAPLQIRCHELLFRCGCGNVGQCRFEDVQAFIKLLVGDYEGNEYAHNVVIGTGGDSDQAVFIAVLRDSLRFVAGRFASDEIFHQFDGAHATEAANFADDLELFLPLITACFEFFAELCGAHAQARGFPPNVPPRPPTAAASITSARPVTAASGKPPPSDFAEVMRSGSTA